MVKHVGEGMVSIGGFRIIESQTTTEGDGKERWCHTQSSHSSGFCVRKERVALYINAIY